MLLVVMSVSAPPILQCGSVMHPNSSSAAAARSLRPGESLQLSGRSARRIAFQWDSHNNSGPLSQNHCMKHFCNVPMVRNQLFSKRTVRRNLAQRGNSLVGAVNMQNQSVWLRGAQILPISGMSTCRSRNRQQGSLFTLSLHLRASAITSYQTVHQSICISSYNSVKGFFHRARDQPPALQPGHKPSTKACPSIKGITKCLSSFYN